MQAFIRDQYRHAKPILLIGQALPVLSLLGMPASLPDGAEGPGLLCVDACDSAATARFLAALARHRHFERESDPPQV